MCLDCLLMTLFLLQQGLEMEGAWACRTGLTSCPTLLGAAPSSHGSSQQACEMAKMRSAHCIGGKSEVLR